MSAGIKNHDVPFIICYVLCLFCIAAVQDDLQQMNTLWSLLQQDAKYFIMYWQWKSGSYLTVTPGVSSLESWDCTASPITVWKPQRCYEDTCYILRLFVARDTSCKDELPHRCLLNWVTKPQLAIRACVHHHRHHWSSRENVPNYTVMYQKKAGKKTTAGKWA